MSYSVDVSIFSAGVTYHETVATGDDIRGNVTPAYGLADPLMIQQSIPDSDKGILAHPDPDECTITLIAANGSTYGKLAEGDPVAVLLYPAASFAGTPVTFYGRIAAGGLSSQPHPLGVMYSLHCVDYTVDLASVMVGTSNWPRQQLNPRITRIFNDANLGFTIMSSSTSFFDEFTPARTGDKGVDALTALLATLDALVQNSVHDENGTDISGVPGSWRTQMRPRVVPVITNSQIDPTTPYSIVIEGAVSKRYRYVPPHRLTNNAGIRRVTAAAANSSPSTGAPILDGARVEFAPSFSSQRGGNGYGNVVVIVDSTGGSSASSRFEYDWRAVIGRAVPLQPSGSWWLAQPVPYKIGGPQVISEIDLIYDTFAHLEVAAEVYRVPYRPSVAGAWTVGTLSYQAWAEPTQWRRPGLTELLTVANVKAGTLPTDREWVTGLVKSTTVTVEKGRPVIDIVLGPNTYDRDLQRILQGSSNGVVSADSPILSTVTGTQLYPRDTFEDYATVRGS